MELTTRLPCSKECVERTLGLLPVGMCVVKRGGRRGWIGRLAGLGADGAV